MDSFIRFFLFVGGAVDWFYCNMYEKDSRVPQTLHQTVIDNRGSENVLYIYFTCDVQSSYKFLSPVIFYSSK